MARITFDDSRWPLVRITFEGTVSDSDFQLYLDRLTTYVMRGEQFALLYDARHSERTPSTHRQMQAEWMKTHNYLTARFCRGIAFVINSSIVRGALTAILWLRPLPCPYLVFANVSDAEVWAQKMLTIRSA